MSSCTTCNNSRIRLFFNPSGVRYATACECVAREKLERMLDRAQMPAHYRLTTLETFEVDENAMRFQALGRARKYLETFTPKTTSGMLFTGSVGTGKTHLAIGILRGAIERGASGLFCDFREVLKRLQHSYSGKSQVSEMEILAPILEANIVVLDELGAARITDWTHDIVEHIINIRYNERRATLVTTNYPFRIPNVIEPIRPGYQRTSQVMLGETLGDRIGARMLSRLAQMCQVIEMNGEDYRAKCKLA